MNFATLAGIGTQTIGVHTSLMNVTVPTSTITLVSNAADKVLSLTFSPSSADYFVNDGLATGFTDGIKVASGGPPVTIQSAVSGVPIDATIEVVQVSGADITVFVMKQAKV